MDWGSIVRFSISACIGPDAIIYALAAIGLNVHFGYTGLLNFGQAGFMAIGAYGMGVAVVFFKTSFWLGIGAGVLTAVVLALILGIPTLRLRADYLAIVTIAASEIIRLTVRSVYFAPETGGSFGLQNFGNSFYELDPFHAQLPVGTVPLQRPRPMGRTRSCPGCGRRPRPRGWPAAPGPRGCASAGTRPG